MFARLTEHNLSLFTNNLKESIQLENHCETAESDFKNQSRIILLNQLTNCTDSFTNHRLTDSVTQVLKITGGEDHNHKSSEDVTFRLHGTLSRCFLFFCLALNSCAYQQILSDGKDLHEKTFCSTEENHRFGATRVSE